MRPPKEVKRFRNVGCTRKDKPKINEEYVMKSKISILLAVFALILSTLACSLGGGLALDNARMAFDSAGQYHHDVFALG